MKVTFGKLILALLAVLLVGVMTGGCSYTAGTTRYSWPVSSFIYPNTEVTIINNMENTYVDVHSSVGTISNLGSGDYQKLVFYGNTERRLEYSVTITIKKQGMAPKSFTKVVRVSRRSNDVASFEVTDGRVRRGRG
jgi:hypothetical protein